MKDSTTGNQRNLSLSERILIELHLKDNLKFKEIASLLSRNPRTISTEVKVRRIPRTKDPELRKVKCAHLSNCSLTDLCSNKYCKKNIPCSKCKLRTCAQYCNTYVPGTCSKLLKPPYVCNGCGNPRTCGYDKMYYRAKHADDQYHEAMRTTRLGINLTPEELNDLDTLVSPLLLKGQSIAHIFATHSDDIKCSKRSLYNYINSGALTAKNIDLPRKVRYKPRKKHQPTIKENQTYRIGRTYNEFLAFSESNPDLSVVEMDTVIGSRSGKCLLTLLFRQSNFMLIFLLESCTQASVIQTFNSIETAIGHDAFKSTFPIILTDNGSEFKDPVSMEMTDYNEQRTKIFFCDPHKSWQKARIEKNHEFIRYVLPKGKSFDKLTQENVTLMANHINSIARASLKDQSSFELANLLLDKDVLKALELQKVAPDEVHLKPDLFRQ